MQSELIGLTESAVGAIYRYIYDLDRKIDLFHTNECHIFLLNLPAFVHSVTMYIKKKILIHCSFAIAYGNVPSTKLHSC